METLIIRADAGPAIGHGHVMRCLALAQAWQERGGRCVFVTSRPAPAIEARLTSEGFAVLKLEAAPGSREDASELAGSAAQFDAHWAVIDGYQFGPEYQQTLKNAGLKLLVIDDYGQIGAYAADIILDQNAGARETLYAHRESTTELLLGTRYAMLRREFRMHRGGKRDVPEVARNILVLLGGSDPANLTVPLLQALSDLPGDHKVTLVAGAGNANIPQARDLAGRSAGKCCLEVEPHNLPDLMSWADVAISSASSTCWELCLFGLPSIVIEVAENQLQLARELECRKIAIRIPLSPTTLQDVGANLQRLLADAYSRDEVSHRARALVDGRGAERVAAFIKAYMFSPRKILDRDCLTLWQWVNHPDVRKASFSGQEIGWNEHNEWFARKLRDEQCQWIIYEDEESAVGTVRVDAISALEGEISLTIAPEYRGQGLAPHLLKRAVRQLFASTALSRIRALIKPENTASVRAFERAGFICVGTAHAKGSEALHFSCERNHDGRELPATVDEPAEALQ